ncbi:MAG: hypothetical protein GY821_13090 [Gammaproteobacteria bacterium]|nr:hypothetical protein [Gammaproteobacteria bacterium]
MEEQKSRCAVWQSLKGWPIHLIIILFMATITLVSFEQVRGDIQKNKAKATKDIVRCNVQIHYNALYRRSATSQEPDETLYSSVPAITAALNGGVLDYLEERDIILLIIIWLAGVILTHSLYRVLKQLNNHIDDSDIPHLFRQKS